MPNKIEKLSIREIIERFNSKNDYEEKEKAVSTSSVVAKTNNTATSKKITVTQNLVRNRIAQIESGDNRIVQQPKRASFSVTMSKKETIEADIVKSRVLHFMRAKSVEEDALPSYKRYSLPAPKSNGFLSLKSQFENLPEDSEQAKGEEPNFRRSEDVNGGDAILGAREGIIDNIDNDIFDDTENSAQTECYYEGHCRTTSYDKISESEQWSFPAGIIDSDSEILPGKDTEEVFEEIFRRCSIEGLIDDVGDEIFEQDEEKRLDDVKNSFDAEIIDRIDAKGHSEILLNKFLTISTPLKENLDTYDEILDQKISHILENDETMEDKGLLSVSHDAKNRVDVIPNKFLTIPTALGENLNIHDEKLDQKIAYSFRNDEIYENKDLPNTPTNSENIQDQILPPLEENLDAYDELLDQNEISMLENNVKNEDKDLLGISSKTEGHIGVIPDVFVTISSTPLEEILVGYDEILDQKIENDKRQEVPSNNLTSIEDMSNELTPHKSIVNEMVNKILVEILDQLEEKSNNSLRALNHNITETTRKDQLEEDLLRTCSDVKSEVKDLQHIASIAAEEYFSDLHNLGKLTQNDEKQLDNEINIINDNLVSRKNSVMEITKMFETHHIPITNRRKSLTEEPSSNECSNLKNGKKRRFSSYTKPILSDDKSVIRAEELRGGNFEPTESSVRKLKMIFEEKHRKNFKEEYKKIDKLKKKLVHNEAIAYAPKILEDVASEEVRLENKKLIEFYREAFETLADPIFILASLYCSLSIIVNFFKLSIYILSVILNYY